MIWWIMIGVFLLRCAWIFWTSIRGIASTSWLIDDSFIEMKIAMNLGQGHGFSLDGIHPTTGAPFFWIYLTSLNHVFFGMATAIRMTLVESTLFGALSSVLTYAIAQVATKDRRIALVAFLLSTFTANAFFNGMNGMDTTLFTFFVLLAVALELGAWRKPTMTPFAWGCLVGLAIGLACMTRGDGIFIAMSIVLVRTYQWYRAGSSERALHRSHLLGLLLIAGLCFSFFMGWQLLKTGSPFPGNQVGRRALALSLHNFSFDEFSLPRYLSIVLWNIFQLEEILTVAMGSTILGVIALLAALSKRELKSLALITGIYTAVFFTLLVGYQWYFANLHGLRYVNPAAHLLFVFVAWLLWNIPLDRWRTVFVSVSTLGLCVFASYKHYQMVTRLPWAQYMSYLGKPDPEKNAEFWGTVDWMRENLPPGTVVGVRDYGRASLFTTARIQDIAGNVDPPVVEALDNGTLKGYLKQKNVEYLLIPSLEIRQDKLYQYIHSNMNLKLVEAAPKSPTQYLYKINW